MLPKNRRIEKTLFSEVFSTGKRLITPYFMVYTGNFGKNEPSRFAFSVSKKICKNATDRNRLRRQGYSIVSKNLKDTKKGFLYIFIYKKGINQVSFQDLEKEIISVIY